MMGKAGCRQACCKKVISWHGTESELVFLPSDSVSQSIQMSKVSLDERTRKVDQFFLGLEHGQGVKAGSWELLLPKPDLSTLTTL